MLNPILFFFIGFIISQMSNGTKKNSHITFYDIQRDLQQKKYNQ